MSNLSILDDPREIRNFTLVGLVAVPESAMITEMIEKERAETLVQAYRVVPKYSEACRRILADTTQPVVKRYVAALHLEHTCVNVSWRGNTMVSATVRSPEGVSAHLVQ